MGRRTHRQALGLWMNGDFVGTWSLAPDTPDTLQYDTAWVQSPEGRPLSLSLPFTPGNAPHRGPAVRAYFENLLPDSRDIRERIARRHGAVGIDAFALLARIGRDCVGALEILPDGEAGRDAGTVQARALNEAEVAQLLRSATTAAPLGLRGADDDLRISIAGAQEKTALLLHNGRWCLPHGSTPTTHILKLPLGLVGGMKIDMRDSVENEWLCARVLRAFGLPVAQCHPLQFEDMKVLAVERFDRRWWTAPDGRPRLLRLPQEDFCQATGTPPDAKYEADGGPGIDRVMRVLDGSTAREDDRRTFFLAQLLFWMLGATDGHAKNFSLFLRPGGRYQLTPLYDVLSAWPVLGEVPGAISHHKARMAMAVRGRNAHWKLREILPRHWAALGQRHGVMAADGRGAAALIEAAALLTPGVVDAVHSELPVGFPAGVADRILGGLADSARRLLAVI